MSSFLSNPAIQMIALFVLAGLVSVFMAFVTIRAFRKLKTNSKSNSEIAEDGERTKALLERYAGKLSDEQQQRG